MSLEERPRYNDGVKGAHLMLECTNAIDEMGKWNCGIRVASFIFVNYEQIPMIFTLCLDVIFSYLNVLVEQGSLLIWSVC